MDYAETTFVNMLVYQNKPDLKKKIPKLLTFKLTFWASSTGK